MTNLIVTFKLKDGASASEYEIWARTKDLPTARGLKSVDGFNIFKAVNRMIGEGPQPFDYVEILQINDFDQLGQDAGTQAMQQVSAELAGFADDLQFMIVEDIEK